MKILVTGASGFLGRHLCSKLKQQGHQLFEANSKNCDLTKAASLAQFVSCKVDRIYHLASWTQAGDFCLYHPGEQWLINQKINTHVLDWWAAHQPQAKIVCMGTSCAYDPGLPLEEENYFKGTPIESLFTYAMGKRMLLTGLIALHKQYGLNYLYLVPSTLYGPNYHEDGRQMHFIFDLVRKILRGARDREPVSLWGDGHQMRELIHVEDFLEATFKLVEAHSNTWINIGAGEGFSIRHFAKQICEVVGYSADQINYDTTKFVGAKSKVLNTTKLKRLLPSFSVRSLKQGLEEVVDWFERKEKCLPGHQTRLL